MAGGLRCSKFLLKQNTDILGHLDMGRSGTGNTAFTVEQCCAQCLKRADCGSFTFNHMNQCWLKRRPTAPAFKLWHDTDGAGPQLWVGSYFTSGRAVSGVVLPETFTGGGGDEGSIVADAALGAAAAPAAPQKSNHKLAIIVAFRDDNGADKLAQGIGRWQNLKEFVPYICAHLGKSGTDFEIIVSEEAPGGVWNKGKLFNAAFLTLEKESAPFDYFVFHDVDQVPISPRNDYHYSDAAKGFVDTWIQEGLEQKPAPHYKIAYAYT